MKRNFTALALLIAVAVLVMGQVRSNKPAGAGAEEEIRRLEQEWLNTYLSGDKAAFNRIVADDFTLTLGNGKIIDKASEMAGIPGPLDASYILKNEDVRVRVYGDAAVVNRRVKDKGRLDGREIDTLSQCTDTWVRRNGRWQVVASHMSRVPQPKAEK